MDRSCGNRHSSAHGAGFGSWSDVASRRWAMLFLSASRVIAVVLCVRGWVASRGEGLSANPGSVDPNGRGLRRSGHDRTRRVSTAVPASVDHRHRVRDDVSRSRDGPSTSGRPSRDGARSAPAPPPRARHRAGRSGRRRAATPSADVVRAFPEWSEAWAALGEPGPRRRRGLRVFPCRIPPRPRRLAPGRLEGERLRPLVAPSNRGFLRCVDGLRAAAAAIGETAEEERCDMFLRQLDPAWPPARACRRSRDDR